MRLATRATCAVLLLAGIAFPPAAARPQTGRADSNVLAAQLSAFLEGGADRSRLGESDALAPLGDYPLAATMAYLLMHDDVAGLKRCYPVLLREVNSLFSPDNLSDAGLVRRLPGSPSSRSLSPAINVFANLELWSLHLIAWKIGAHEDALDYLAWSKRQSETVTRSFYSISREEFFPIDASGRFGAGGTPAELLPLVLDRALGASARARLVENTSRRYDASSLPVPAGMPGTGWDDPAARPVILDLLSSYPGWSGALAAELSNIARRDAVSTPRGPWNDYWRAHPSMREGLFPSWAPISALANLTLLLERESLALDAETAAFRAGIDTIDAALSKPPADLVSYAAALASINRLMARIGRFSEYAAGPKERWRVAEESKWVRVSPRIKRLVSEGCGAVLEELVAVKAILSERIEKTAGISFRLELPGEPVSPGDRVWFIAVLGSDTPVAIQKGYLHIGESRWEMPSGPDAPRTLAESFALPPDAPPGIATVTAHIDFLAEGRRIELWRRESAAVAMPHDVSIDLPAGRRIERAPVPIRISIRYRSERDVQGEIDGSFLRELVTEPLLPARFLVSAGKDRTSLTLSVAPGARLAPGSYPFSLVVSIGGTSLVSFADSLIHPFRWIHLGPFPHSARILSDGARYQADLFKRHPSTDGTEIGWQEAPGGAVDTEGALRPQRIYDEEGPGSALFYTLVDSPTRAKIRWSLATADAVALWINGLPVLPAVSPGYGRIEGEAELRKGPNSFLVATSWELSPAAIRFEIRDENGLPPAGLNNELSEIVDGYDRIVSPRPATTEQAGSPARMQPVSFSLEEPRAREVSLIGSFNNWDPAATPMKRDEDGIWRASIMLKPGRYTYKFVVDRTRKIVDPRNAGSEPDGFGGSSSVIDVQ